MNSLGLLEPTIYCLDDKGRHRGDSKEESLAG